MQKNSINEKNLKAKYLQERAVKKKKAVGYVWLLLFVGLIIVAVVVKVALSGSIEDMVSGAPSSDDVYTIAKDYVRPTLKSSEAQFSDSEYQFGKKEDSVYVIKSSVITKDASGQDEKTEFEVTLHYKGGRNDDEKNWDLLDIKEN